MLWKSSALCHTLGCTQWQLLPCAGPALAPRSPAPVGCPCWKAAALPLPCKPAAPLRIAPCCNTEPPAGTGSQPSGRPSVPCSLGERDASRWGEEQSRRVRWTCAGMENQSSAPSQPGKHKFQVLGRDYHRYLHLLMYDWLWTTEYRTIKIKNVTPVVHHKPPTS